MQRIFLDMMIDKSLITQMEFKFTPFGKHNAETLKCVRD